MIAIILCAYNVNIVIVNYYTLSGRILIQDSDSLTGNVSNRIRNPKSSYVVCAIILVTYCVYPPPTIVCGGM